MLAVDHVLLGHREALNFWPAVCAKTRVAQLVDIANPLIPLLPAHQIKRGVALMVGSAAILPVVMVVRHLMRMHAVLIKQLGHRIIKRLQWPPRAMQEIVAAGMHFAPRWHARHRAHIEIVELHCSLGQALKVRRLDPFVTVGRHEVSTQSVVHHHHATFLGRALAHARCRSLGRGDWLNARGYVLM